MSDVDLFMPGQYNDYNNLLCFPFQRHQISVYFISSVFYNFYFLSSPFKLFWFGSMFSSVPFMTLILFFLFSFLLLTNVSFIFVMVLFFSLPFPPSLLSVFMGTIISLSSLVSRRTVQSLDQLHGSIFEMCDVDLYIFWSYFFPLFFIQCVFSVPACSSKKENL